MWFDRYVLYDHAYESSDGRPQSKLYFVLWAPPDAPSLSKFGYSSHKTSATKGLPGVFDVRATCQAELEVLWGITKEDVAADDWDPGLTITHVLQGIFRILLWNMAAQMHRRQPPCTQTSMKNEEAIVALLSQVCWHSWHT